MPRPTSKSELISAASETYEQLNELITSLTQTELLTPMKFSKTKKEAHWRRDKNLRDVLTHLYEWHQLLINWVTSNLGGEARPLLPQPYNWRNYGEMNIEFWKKHQDTPLEEAKDLLEKSHREVIKLADTFSNEELFSKGVFPWAGNNALGSYFVSNLSSHYNWAVKKLKAHRRNCKA